ncbi:MAG: tetratricopeptide repeat protein [SAR324 cluster bacterium]|nr:tetratricopeptide repeat protein [SAR324 cluster bacterium]
MTTPRRPPRLPLEQARAFRLGALLVVFCALLVGGGCESRQGAVSLSAKAKRMWEAGNFADAARNFVTLSEIYPGDRLAEESIFWAANLYQHYLDSPKQAIRYYQQLLVQFPEGSVKNEAKENLALLYEAEPSTRHRALQIFQQLLLAEELAKRRDYFQFKIAAVNLAMGKLDQARFEFRNLLTRHAKSKLVPEAYYLVGYSYYLEERFPLARVAFSQTVRDFPGSPIASRAAFFIADSLEEQGKLSEALKSFQSLRGKYKNEKILDKRIHSLRGRLRKGVR